ncbi:hypothetical protein LP316_08560 [Thalassotalea sp. LPB0316]|uniref:hypothetical protein n=1 Tax=Thalassotalea sp. LPB0316 TaxID=2769490 RepID=UPI00186788C3|nr:hypothetical protein [Thalassotalea sp. LPB0316]QOL24420.1 hypothetical protein LP316_08560 [Thalassotalea sp. LPB0316]
MTKQVLYVATLFRKKNCSASIRNVALVNALLNSGVAVTVVTVKYPREVLDDYLVEQVDKRVTLIELDAGALSNYIPTNRAVITTNNSFSARVKSLLKQIYYFPSIDKGILKHLNQVSLAQIDLVISSSDSKTSHVFAARLIKSSTVVWAQIWGDPWEHDIAIKSNFNKWRIRLLEKKLLTKANYIFYVSLPTLKQMQKKYREFASKMTFLPRSYFKEINSEITYKCGNLKLLYTGGLNGRNIMPIIQSIVRHNTKHDIKIELTILGKVTDEQLREFKLHQCVRYGGSASLQTTLKAYEATDSLLFISNSSGANQIPGKLFDYFGTNKPILALLENDADEVGCYIKSTKRCLVFKNDTTSIDLVQFIERSRLKHDILTQFSPETVAQKLIDIVDF